MRVNEDGFRTVLGALGLSALAACGVVQNSALSGKTDGSPEPFLGPVPRAECGPGSNPETGMQGEGGAPAVPYTCNMELLGQEGTTSQWQMAAYGHCAYYLAYADEGGVVAGTQRQNSAVVVDVSDSSNPIRSALLTSPGIANGHESLVANEKRSLLGGAESAGPHFDVYDVSKDCAHPALLSSLPTAVAGHEGEWAPDGLTYYATSGTENWTAIDVSDPTQTKTLDSASESDPILYYHGLSVSDDGNRVYQTRDTGDKTVNGLEIRDVSEIQSRKPDAQAYRISIMDWASEDGSYWAQGTIPVTINGKPYVIQTDEGGPIGGRIIDISDEKNPFLVAKLVLEVNMGGTSGAVGAAHYCGVPQRHEPEIVACSYQMSGIRVFDIRDPYLPKEIAYFNPAPKPKSTLGSTGAASLASPATESCVMQVRIIPERGELWTACNNNEFLALKFTNGVWPFKD